MKITNCKFDNLTYGWYFQKVVSADVSNVNFVNVVNSTFNNNIHKGIYTEKLSNATFTGCTFDNNGMNAALLPSYFAPWSAGADVNLKAGNYSNISFDNCVITNNGIGGAKEGAGIMIKARNDGATYGAFPATLTNVSINDCIITGNERGIRFGEPNQNNSTPSNVVLNSNTINNNRKHYSLTDGTDYGDVVNMLSIPISLNSETINAGQNAWYITNGQNIQTIVNSALVFDIIYINNGSYSQASTININKSLSIIGETESGVIIDLSTVAGYGFNITTSNISLKNFTVLPNPSTGTYTIKTNTVSTTPFENLVYDHITINGAKKTPFDVHGFNNVTLTNLTATNTTAGVGIALSGCNGVTLTGITTSGNAWGGVAVYVSKYIFRGSSNVTFDFAQNNINDFFYIEDEFGYYNTNINVSNWTYGIDNIYGTGKSTPDNARMITYTNKPLADALGFGALYNIKYSNTLSYCWNPALQYYVGPIMTIRRALDVAAAGSTINITNGTYTEGNPQLVINKDVTLSGENKELTIIKPAQNTNNSGDGRGFIVVNSGVDINLSSVTVDGDGKLVNIGILSHGTGTIDNCILKNIGYYPSGPSYAGRGIAFYDNNMTISNNTLSNIGRIGIYTYGASVTNGQILNNTFVGKGEGNYLDYGIEVEGGAKAIISGNHISNCQGIASVDNSGSAGIMATTFFANGTQAEVTNNIFENNSVGIAVGYDLTDQTTVIAHQNSFLNNDYAISSSAPVVNATCNWYGTAEAALIAEKIDGNVTFVPYLKTQGGDCNGGLMPDDASVALAAANYTSPVWTDSNPLNSNATLVGVNAPIINTPDINFNNLSSVVFNGSNVLSIPYNNIIGRINNASAKTLFIYFNTNNITSRQVIFEAGSPNSGFNVYIYNSKLYLGIWNASQRRFFSQSISTNTNYLISIEYDGSLVKTSINNILSSSTTFNGLLANNNNANGIGASYNGTRYIDNVTGTGVYHNFNGKIAEILCYNSSSTDLRKDIIDYINAKYHTRYSKETDGLIKAIDANGIQEISWDESGNNYFGETGLSVNNDGEYLNVNFASSEQLQGKLNLYDVTGMIVKSIFNGTFNNGTNSFSVETNELSSGVYFLTVETSTGVDTKQVIIVK